jgi:hypothetical protein
MNNNRELTGLLLDRGISVKDEPAMLLYAAAQKKDVALADRLIRAGADVNGQKHAALSACMDRNDLPSAMFLLKCGADFEDFQSMVMKGAAVPGKKLNEQETGFMFALKGFWENNINHSQGIKSEDDFDMEQ